MRTERTVNRHKRKPRIKAPEIGAHAMRYEELREVLKVDFTVT